MDAISFRQPWAHAILFLGKRIENRVSRSSVRHYFAKRGREFLIHASAATAPRRKFHDDCEALRELVGYAAWEATCLSSDGSIVFEQDRHGVWVPGEGLPLGGIVGQATTQGVFLSPGSDLFKTSDMSTHLEWYQRNVDRRWHNPEQYGYVLDNVEPVNFFACKGALGVFQVAGPDGIFDEYIP